MINNIFLTGATSFTGIYIAKELLDSSYSVYAPLRQPKEKYINIKKQRLELVPNLQIIAGCSLNDESLINFINEYKPSIFINHAADTENYRSTDYDVTGKLVSTIGNIRNIIQSLKNSGCQLFIHSGSAFEPAGGYANYGISPYGVSKKMAWDLIAYYCQEFELPCLKIYIPNPYGHLENEDRLLPVLYRSIQDKKEFILSNASTVRNNILGKDLAKYYLQASQLNNLPGKWIMDIRPVGYIETQLDFVKRATQEFPYNIDQELLNKYLKIQE